MAQFSRPEVVDIGFLVSALEEQLRALDELGFGIAAIHVNAAIEQLRSNISQLAELECDTLDPANQWIVAHG